MEDEMRQLNRETGNSENTHKDHKLKQDKDRAADDGAPDVSHGGGAGGPQLPRVRPLLGHDGLHPP